jgi:hypothetical protein
MYDDEEMVRKGAIAFWANAINTSFNHYGSVFINTFAS